ncbi:MAG: Ig-like domain-containing protein [Pseudomonadota bacterium]
MIRKCFLLFSLAIFVGFIGTMMLGCSSDSSGPGSGDGTSTTTKTPASIRVTASPDSINPGQTTTIKAVVYDASGNAIAGVKLTFTLDNPQVASVTDSATTGADGAATVTFKARDLAGSVIVTATDGTITSDPPVTVSILSTTAPTQMNLTVNPTAILVQGTASVKAQLLDATGNPVPDGTSVSFSSDNELYGVFTSGTATTNSGFASATFEAAGQPGTASVTVRSGNLTKQIEISILPALAAAIKFVSATPQRIALQGSGDVETSIVQFVVNDSNNDPVEGATVSFSMTGPNGGEYIDPPPDPTPNEIEVSTNAQGIAQVILHSGLVAGPISIVGTTFVRNNDGNLIAISAQSSVISIGGGVPSAKRFGTAATVLNIPGWNCQNVETEISSYLADRFGNYNILKGTTVSFVSEAGLAIDTSNVTLEEDGIAAVIARTQRPTLFDGPEDVLPLPWENEIRNYIVQNYGYQIDNHPRDGLCSVLVYVRGEELFNDSNANGTYDVGETFDDTAEDPFIDYNDNGSYDGANSDDPEEIYIDAAGNHAWDGANGAWDAEKTISANMPILITGKPRIFWSLSSPGFNIGQGGSASLRLIICDENGNAPSGGTKLSVSTDNGKLYGVLTHDYPNSNRIGESLNGQLDLLEYTYTIADNDSTDTDPPKPTSITATITWENPCGGSETNSVAVGGMLD